MKNIRGVLKRIAALSLAAMLFAGSIPGAAFAAEAGQASVSVDADDAAQFVPADTDDTADEVNAAAGEETPEEAGSEEKGLRAADTEEVGETGRVTDDTETDGGTVRGGDDTSTGDNTGMDDTSAAEDDASEGLEASGSDTEQEEARSFSAFEASKTLAGITVSVSAEEGVFPEGAELSVGPAGYTAAKQAKAAVSEERDEDTRVAKSFTYDIKVLDRDGNEIEPADDSKVRVSFSLDEVADKNLTTNIYHITSSAEKLTVKTQGSTASAETGGVSLYTVEFTYNELQYVLEGDSSVALSDFLCRKNLILQFFRQRVYKLFLYSS